MTDLKLKYKRRRIKLSEYWLFKYGTTSGEELVRLLRRDKFISHKINPADLDARWTDQNTIELWYKHERLPGRILIAN